MTIYLDNDANATSDQATVGRGGGGVDSDCAVVSVQCAKNERNHGISCQRVPLQRNKLGTS